MEVRLEDLVIEDLGEPQRKHGKWLLWRCPFHKDHDPSLAVTPDTQSYYCFGCQTSGDTVGWLMRYRKMSYRQAMGFTGQEIKRNGDRQRPKLQHKDPPPVPWQMMLHDAISEAKLEDPRILEWLHQRNVQLETANAFGLKFVESGIEIEDLWVPAGLIIPCYTHNALWYVKVRRPPWIKKGRKYTYVKGSTHCLFGLPTITGQKPLVVAESELDAILLWQEVHDIVDVVAAGGAGQRLIASDLYHIYRSIPWYVILDNDQAGKQGVKWWQNYAPYRVRPLKVPEGLDVTEFSVAGGDLRGWIRESL